MAAEIVLVIEDNAVNRELVCDLLTYQGYRILEAGTASDGVEIAVKEQPDLIIMDIQLPGLDGVSALARLRSYPPTVDIPVVALTAFALKSEQARFTKAGFDACLTKPINIKEFSNRIRDIFDQRRLRAHRGP